jgi:Cysteine-rich secretory protein family
MKVLISLILLCSLTLGAEAATLAPSLTAQIARQEAVNKRNALADKRQALQQRKIAIAKRSAYLQARRDQAKTTAPTVSSAPTIVSQSIRTIPPTITPPRVSSSTATPVSGVDISRVRSTWLSWYNGTRTGLGLSSYSYDTRLDSTAHDWNIVFAEGKGMNHHRRNPGDSYYDFAVIDNWFIARGVNPKIVSRAKHTENVGYGYYSCSQSDCTDALISSIRSTYDFFMSEKGKAYDAHYRSIVQPNFSKIGLDVIVVPSERRYYLTVHYITE